MSKLTMDDIFSSIEKLNIKSTDILIIKINKYAEDDDDMKLIENATKDLEAVLVQGGFENPLIVLGPDADLTKLDDETMFELGYQKKNIPEDNLDEYYS